MSQVGLVESLVHHIGGKRQMVYLEGIGASVVAGENMRRIDLLTACLCPTFITISRMISNISVLGLHLRYT